MLHLTVVSSPPPPHHLHHHVPISSASAGDGLQSLSSTVLAVVIVCGSCVRNSVRDSLRVHTYPAVSVSTNRLCPPHRKACVVLRCSCKIEIYIYLFSFFFFKVHSPVFCAVQVLRFSPSPPPSKFEKCMPSCTNYLLLLQVPMLWCILGVIRLSV